MHVTGLDETELQMVRPNGVTSKAIVVKAFGTKELMLMPDNNIKPIWY